MTVVADLPTLKSWLGTLSSADDALLQIALDQATSWITARVYPEALADDEVQGAILDQASRWYQRRRSPEGVAGFSEFGAVRISALDPDIRAKIEYALDLTNAGVA